MEGYGSLHNPPPKSYTVLAAGNSPSVCRSPNKYETWLLDASQLPTSIAATGDTHRYATGMAVSNETLLKKMPAILM